MTTTESTPETGTVTGEAPTPTGPVSTIDYSEKIPNNVDVKNARKLQRALEIWQPKFLDWWKNLGPSIPTHDVYLRTAIEVGRDGWAHFDRVPLDEYRWGLCPAAIRTGRSRSASTRVSPPGRRCPASTARSCAG